MTGGSDIDGVNRVLSVKLFGPSTKDAEYGMKVGKNIHRVGTNGGNTVAVITPVVEKLMAKGLAFADPDGTVKTNLSEQALNDWILELGVCDFCDEVRPAHMIPTPDFSLPDLDEHSTGGWAACDTCYALVNENKRAELLRRAVERANVGKFGAAAIQALHKEFWNARETQVQAAGTAEAFMGFINGTLSSGVKVPITERDKRINTLSRLTGLTSAELDALQMGNVSREAVVKLSAWYKKYGSTKEGQAESIRQVEKILGYEARPHFVGSPVPHWQRALDMKFSAAKFLTEAMKLGGEAITFTDPINLYDARVVKETVRKAEVIRTLKEMNFGEDLKLFRVAEAYSFNGETTDAIREAAKSIPHEAALSSIETPAGAGWFWFGQPLPLIASPVASDHVHALLWGWSNGSPAIVFSVYVLDEKHSFHDDENLILPSTRWSWPLSMSFHDMLAFNRESHTQTYGPGSKFDGDPNIIGQEEDTLNTIAELSLFFLASCMWFKQKVLISAPGHVERHARKRFVKEHKLKEPPSVLVIALRRSEHVRKETTEPSGETRNYTCRWIVRGHPRLQRCGPGRVDQKLIWIDPHPAGPADKPLRTRERVYAVIR